MHTRSGLLAVLALASLLAGCAPGSEIRSAQQVEEISIPQFLVVEGQTVVERFDPPGAGGLLEMTVGTSVYNPNSFPVKLTSIDYSVFLEDREVSRGKSDLDMFLDSEGSAPLQFEIESALQDRPGLLRQVVAAFAGEPLLFRIEGRLTFNSLAYEFRTNRRVLVEGGTLARETVEPPVLRLNEEASQVYLLNPEVPVVRLVLDISNPGDIGYFLYGKDLELALAGHPVATDDLRPVPVPAGTDTTVDIIFYPQRATLGADASTALDAALAGIPTSVDLSGRLAMDVLGVDAFPVPEGWTVTGFVQSHE